MDLKKEPITFSITGILSTGTSSRSCDNVVASRAMHFADRSSPPSTVHSYRTEVIKSRPDFYVRREEDRYFTDYFGNKRKISHSPPELYAPVRSDAVFEEYHESRESTPSPPKIFRPSLYTRHSDDKYHQISSPPLTIPNSRSNHETTMTSSQNGRFRPPPFFDTVLTLRKRLYYLGGKEFSVDEPPTDRNVHKMWRSIEKHKVNYSLQHYFYVASLSNRCFSLVQRIHHKVSCGLLEGSRDREVNQSYFNFLYGKTEDERYELLRLLETGEISPKTIAKAKQNNSKKSSDESSNNNNTCSTKCHNCKEQIERLIKEKEILQKQLMHLQRKQNQVNLVDLDLNGRFKSKSI
ncbi:uncharacterized protein [Clytia hemisphaerica]|uniref:Uncharacterized protein n=1 Tax=Clytia hemisphaerica TaxID=252671 RepID=A0A7M5V071_9CNID